MKPAEIRKWRFYAESLIEETINLLDKIDGDADLEDDADAEPSLASPVGDADRELSVGRPVC